MRVYFVTRFSIHDPQFRGYRLSRSFSAEEYERRLFGETRLRQKFDMFESITLPSILGQGLGDWEWLIYTSNRLPAAYSNRLQGLVSRHANICLVPVRNFAEFFEKHEHHRYGPSFATVRLDDDDGLSHCFVERLQHYSATEGCIVSFTEGRRVTLSNQRVVFGTEVSVKNIALGMTGIGLPIYTCGRHRDIHTRYAVIYDATPAMFLLGCSPFSDSERPFIVSDSLVAKLGRFIVLTFTRPGRAFNRVVEAFRRLLRR